MSDCSNTLLLVRWIRASGDELLHFLRRRLHCREAAADVAQETYLRLHTAHSAATSEHLNALAFRIAANLTVDYQRRQQVRKHWEQQQDRTQAFAPPSDFVLIRAERIAAIKAALDRLPINYRNALVLHKGYGMTHAEVAQHMGIAPRTVAKYLIRALQLCRPLLEDI